MKPPLMTREALAILARCPEGRVELQKQRARARSQERQLREEVTAQTERLRNLGELVSHIDEVLGRESA
jgi:hypothetical protein